MATRKNHKSKKSSKRFRKTRSKRGGRDSGRDVNRLSKEWIEHILHFYYNQEDISDKISRRELKKILKKLKYDEDYISPITGESFPIESFGYQAMAKVDAFYKYGNHIGGGKRKTRSNKKKTRRRGGAGDNDSVQPVIDLTIDNDSVQPVIDLTNDNDSVTSEGTLIDPTMIDPGTDIDDSDSDNEIAQIDDATLARQLQAEEERKSHRSVRIRTPAKNPLAMPIARLHLKPTEMGERMSTQALDREERTKILKSKNSNLPIDKLLEIFSKKNYSIKNIRDHLPLHELETIYETTMEREREARERNSINREGRGNIGIMAVRNPSINTVEEEEEEEEEDEYQPPRKIKKKGGKIKTKRKSKKSKRKKRKTCRK